MDIKIFSIMRVFNIDLNSCWSLHQISSPSRASVLAGFFVVVFRGTFFRLSSFQRSERRRRRWRRRAGGTQDRSSFHQSRSYGTPQTIRHGESGRRASMVLIVIVGTLVRWSFRYEMIGIKMLWNILFILYINSITDQRPLLTFSCIFLYFSIFHY